jgi:hypothetical protein
MGMGFWMGDPMHDESDVEEGETALLLNMP